MTGSLLSFPGAVPQLMWAQRLCAPSRLEYVQVPAPEPGRLGEGQVLLRTAAGGICGSDAPKFGGHKGATLDRHGTFRPGPPGYPLHEVVGEVVASRYPQVSVGELVVGWATSSDGLAEYVVTSGAEVYGYDPSFDTRAAVLIQSLACVLYPLADLPVAGLHVAVLGLGPIGLLFAHALKNAGAARVTGVDPVNRSSVAARRFGLDAAICATSGTWASGVTDTDRPDLVVESVGHQVSTLQHAIMGVAVGGTILYFGIPDDEVYPLDMERLMRRNLTLIGGVTRRRREMLARGASYLAAHPELAADLVSGVYPADRAQDAFEAATRAAADRLKVLVTMTEVSR